MQSPARSRTPVSTYRLQLHRDFGFRDALALIDYLDALGVSDCYSSPFLQASPGSTHGYDICDHTALNRELGSEEDFQAFARNLATRRMGLMLDFVPNHMGIDPQSNPWWRDVLQRGERSRFARFFDIDWTPLKRELRGKVLLPILGDQYGVVLERGELRVQWQQGEPVLRYFERCLPLDPLTWPDILEHRFERIARDTSLAADDIQALHDLSRRLRELAGAPAGGGNESDWRARCDEERARLARLVNGTAIGQQLEDALRDFNGTADDPRSFDTLHALLERQAYRLAYWRTASHEINYRRFFDINELAGLRMEDGEVFAETHALVLRLIRAGAITALRLDHIDGLYDPLQYLDRLQRAIAGESGSEAQGPSPSWFFVVVEKILSTGEVLPERWPVFGTSGYDFLNDLNRLFIDHSRERRCQQIYRRFTGSEQAFADVGYHSKKLIMGTTMASELNVLAHAFNTLSELDRRTRDFTLNS
ncbi:MAG TPA: alpha-amylase family glycosyl hydrolase, partial [Terriglobales bacterium]|nr:alpha-amylase family glycosyl hydrolase [Terriglobales bacterium]